MGIRNTSQAHVWRSTATRVMLMSWVLILRTSIICAILLLAEACDDRWDIAGQYVLIRVDGISASEYTMEDSAGAIVTAAGGGLDLCGDEQYRMTVSHRDENGKQRVVMSSGSYAWDGILLVLAGSSLGAQLTATVADNTITVEIDDHVYEFRGLPQLPPAIPPSCDSTWT